MLNQQQKNVVLLLQNTDSNPQKCVIAFEKKIKMKRTFKHQLADQT